MCFFPFGCIWDHYATAQTWSKTRQTGAINAKVRATKSCRNFSQWTLLIYTIGPKTHVLVHFFSFGCICETIWLLHKTRCKMGQPGAIKAEVRATNLIRNSQNECSRSTYWTLSSSFHSFLSIWVHLEPFRYCTKLAAKHAKMVQLMQKFVPWCLVRIFATKAPDPHHWTLNSSLVRFFPFGCILDRFATARNLVQKRKLVQLMQMFMHDVVLEFFATNTPDPHHWTLNSCFGVFLSILVHLGPFRYCTKLGAKWANLLQLMHKFVPQSLVRISWNR